MCGIVGEYALSGPSPGRAKALMALAPRGPDASGTSDYAECGVWLGHTRLAIIDLSSAGSQPMLSADGRFVIVFNGEVYNFRELREELKQQGYTFRGHSDTEVVLALYIRERAGMLSRLNGVFALAAFDRVDGELLLARDALGVKPLYFHQGVGGFSFASELKSLFHLIPKGTLDVESIHRYLTFLWCPGEGTPLREVRKVLPGEALRVRAGKVVERWSWYRLPTAKLFADKLEMGECVEGSARELRAAVHRQMVADVPVGAFLSGGLDSSAIVAFARELSPGLQCFTIDAVGASDTGDADDLPYAKQVAKHLGVPLNVVTVDSAAMAASLERMVSLLDEPLADPAALNVFYISELARKSGIKVLLSGAGGDDLFTGYRRHAALQYERLWSGLPRVAREWLTRSAAALDQRSAVGRRVARMFAHASEDASTRLTGYFSWAAGDNIRALYSPSFAAELGHVRADQPMRDYLKSLPNGATPLQQMLSLEQRFFLADHNLIYTDKMSMAASVEVRVPFLDLELVEFAARIPDRYKQRGRLGKWVLRKAMEPLLPRDVIYRPKTGFGAPLRRWVRHELRELIGDMLSNQSIKKRGLFHPAAVQKLIADNDAGRVDGAYTIFSLLCIEIWCRRFLTA